MKCARALIFFLSLFKNVCCLFAGAIANFTIEKSLFVYMPRFPVCYHCLYNTCILYPLYVLRVKTDSETGQMIISGMGELHLDIVKDRLLREYKVETYLGPTLVAYRECIRKPSSIIDFTFDK